MLAMGRKPHHSFREDSSEAPFLHSHCVLYFNNILILFKSNYHIIIIFTIENQIVKNCL